MKRFLSIIALTLTVNASVTAQTHPYQNTSLTARERATDLCSRLTLDEKAMLMLDESPAIPRMGIKKFFWWWKEIRRLQEEKSWSVKRRIRR